MTPTSCAVSAPDLVRYVSSMSPRATQTLMMALIPGPVGVR